MVHGTLLGGMAWMQDNVYSLGEFKPKVYEPTSKDEKLTEVLKSPMAQQFEVKRVAIVGDSGWGKLIWLENMPMIITIALILVTVLYMN